MARNKSNLIVFLVLLFLNGCDFASRLQKDILKAQELLSEHNFEQAAEQYKRILSQNPPEKVSTKIYFQLGEVYSLYLNEEYNAIEQFENVVKTTSNPYWVVKASEKIADINFQFLKNYRKSADLYRRLIGFKPQISSIDLYELRLGVSLLKMDEFKQAKQTFQSISSDVTHTYYRDSYYYLGLVYFNQKKWKRAISFWEQYIRREKRKDKIIETKFLIANAYETMEALKKAYRIYYSILPEYPNPEVVKNRLTSLYKRRIARKR